MSARGDGYGQGSTRYEKENDFVKEYPIRRRDTHGK
jgi:hypothetical protein